MEEDLTEGLRSEVYSQFEQIIEDRDISYPSSMLIDDELVIESLNFRRIEGKEKFYNVEVGEDLVEVAVKVEEIDEMLEEGGKYGVSEIKSLNDRNRLGAYLEDYFSVRDSSLMERTF